MARHPPEIYRRRRWAATVGLLVLGALVAIAIESATGGPEARLSADEQEVVAVARVAQEVPIEQLIGQKLIVRLSGEATADLLDAARSGEIGGVIAFPTPGQQPDDLALAISRLQDAAAAGGNPPLIVAIDQEGGKVKRLADGPPELSPPRLGRMHDPVETREAGKATGSYLADHGINADLAPVVDLGLPGTFLGERTFGDDPRSVAELGGAFADGLANGGVVATAKHFPGLGSASVNTDDAPSVVDAPERDLERGLIPFEALIEGGVGMVMVANATYTAYDPDRPGVFSADVVDVLLRDESGFEGVAISDDLDAGSIREVAAPRRAAVEATDAGIDLLLFSKASAAELTRGLEGGIERGTLAPETLARSYVRIRALKASLPERP